MSISLEVIAQKLDDWIEATKEYRRLQELRQLELCKKTTSILIKLEELPCDAKSAEHVGRIVVLENFKAKTEREVGRVLLYVFLGLFSAGVLWGTLVHTVRAQEREINNLNAIHPRATK